MGHGGLAHGSQELLGVTSASPLATRPPEYPVTDRSIYSELQHLRKCQSQWQLCRASRGRVAWVVEPATSAASHRARSPRAVPGKVSLPPTKGLIAWYVSGTEAVMTLISKYGCGPYHVPGTVLSPLRLVTQNSAQQPREVVLSPPPLHKRKRRGNEVKQPVPRSDS